MEDKEIINDILEEIDTDFAGTDFLSVEEE